MDLTMLTYALFQSATPASDLPTVLAARGTVGIVSTPLGIALGGPLVSVLGGGGTLVASGLATVLLAAVSLLLWPRESASSRHEQPVEAAAAARTLP